MASIDSFETGATGNCDSLAKSGFSGASSGDSLSPREPSTAKSIATKQQEEGAEGKKILPRSLLTKGHLFHFGWHIVCILGVDPNEMCHFTFMTLPPEDRGVAPEFFSTTVYKMGSEDLCLDREYIVLSEMSSCGADDCDFDTPQWCVYTSLMYPEYAPNGYVHQNYVEKEGFAWQGDASTGSSCFHGILPDDKLNAKYINSHKGPRV